MSQLEATVSMDLETARGRLEVAISDSKGRVG